MSVFKACDIRGRYGDELTTELALKVGKAVGTMLGGEAAVVGGDLRPSTMALKDALIEGLMASGVHVIDLGVLPTPAFYFAKAVLRARGGVMVTGSHNPAGDNGFKIALSDWPISPAEMAEIQARVSSSDLVEKAGSYEKQDITERYVVSLESRFQRMIPKRVVVDAGNGSYSSIAPRVLRGLGHDVVELFCEPDGSFPGRSPNPSVAKNLRELQDTVRRNQAGLGVAFDGDGDRAVFVDELGRAVESDRSIVLFARHLLSQTPGKVIYDLKCSSVVPEAVREAGGEPIMERSGHAFIKTALLRYGAILGGEISGHFFLGELGYDDALFATLIMLRIMANEGRPLSSLVDGVPRYPITPDIRVPCPANQAQAILAELERTFVGTPDLEITTLDGVRIAWPDGWALVRPSVTEPLVTLRFEAHSEARLLSIQEDVAAASPRLRRIWRP